MTVKTWITDRRPSRRTLLWMGIIGNTELLLILVYLLGTNQQVKNPLFYVWPFVWINAAVWAFLRVEQPDASVRATIAAGALAGLYFVVLSYFGGLVGLGGDGNGLRLAAGLPPGWGPALVYSGSAITLVVMPFKLIGYGVLAYLVGVTVLAANRIAWTGLVGLFSCVSCSWPIFATAIAWIFGSASAVGSVALGATYPLSTLAYLSAVGLLVWQPTSTRS